MRRKEPHKRTPKKLPDVMRALIQAIDRAEQRSQIFLYGLKEQLGALRPYVSEQVPETVVWEAVKRLHALAEHISQVLKWEADHLEPPNPERIRCPNCHRLIFEVKDITPRARRRLPAPDDGAR